MSADNWAVCPRCAQRGTLPTANQFREDYEIYGADEGTVVVDYRGRCQDCGLTLEFTYHAPIPGVDDPEPEPSS